MKGALSGACFSKASCACTASFDVGYVPSYLLSIKPSKSADKSLPFESTSLKNATGFPFSSIVVTLITLTRAPSLYGSTLFFPLVISSLVVCFCVGAIISSKETLADCKISLTKSFSLTSLDFNHASKPSSFSN